MNVTYQKLQAKDVNILVKHLEMYQEAFEREDFECPEVSYLQSLLEKETMFFLTALAGDEVVGGLTAYLLPSVYEPFQEVYLFDMAVKPSFQRKGIGTQLIQELRKYCQNLNIKVFFVQADWEDTHAIEFYKATGGRLSKVLHFTYDV